MGQNLLISPGNPSFCLKAFCLALAAKSSYVGIRSQPIDLAAKVILTTAIDRILRGTIEDTGILTIAALVGEESLQDVLERRFG